MLITPEQLVYLRAAHIAPLVVHDVVFRIPLELGCDERHGIPITKALVHKGLLSFSCEETDVVSPFAQPGAPKPKFNYVPGTERWNITAKGVAILNSLDAGAPGPKQARRTVEFTAIDRLLVWWVGKAGAFRLTDALGHLATTGVRTYGGVVFAVQKNVTIGMFKPTAKRRGWFVGELTEKGREKFLEEFPGHEPK